MLDPLPVVLLGNHTKCPGSGLSDYYLKPKQIECMKIFALRKDPPGSRSLLNKKWMIMRLAAFLLLVATLQVNANATAQKITIVASDIPLEKVLIKIKKQSGYAFFWKDQLVSAAPRVSVQLKDASLTEALDACFRNLPFSYRIENNFVYIFKKETFNTPVNTPVPESVSALITIRGIVTNSQGQPLAQVSVTVKGTSKGTTTNAAGAYSISVEKGEVLQFSFIGYKTEEIVAGDAQEINVSLSIDVADLGDVVVVGYGVVKKTDLTGAVASVKGKDINSFPTNNIMYALKGRAAGVQVQQNSGQPGSNVSIRIRGTNSIQGNNEPLYVVDGIPLNGAPTLLSNADIESIEVLKDASATAIYGSRGSNGVVLITTKHGKEGKAKVEYDGSFSTQKVRKRLELLNAKQYAQFYNEQRVNDGLAPYFTDEQINQFDEGTDWQSIIFRNAPIHNHSLNISGGNKHTQFSFGGGYLDQTGIIKNSGYTRSSARININHDISKKLSIAYSAIFSQSKTEENGTGSGSRGSDLLSGALSAPPTLNPYNADGTYRVLSTAYPFSSNVIINPLNFMNELSDVTRLNKELLHAALVYKPLEGLIVKISAALDKGNSRNNYYKTKKFVNSTGNAIYSTSEYSSKLNENVVTYSKKFAREHDFSLTGAFTYQDYLSTSSAVSGQGYISDVPESYDIGSASSLGTPATSYLKWNLFSYLGRLNYSFREKFLLTLSFRSDGSSRYSEGNKWGHFPSGALAWRLSKENFLKKSSFISDLKLRVGYGETGSTAIDPYQTLNMLLSGKTVFANSLYTIYAPGTRLPSNLKWETTSQTNIGIDAAFLYNRIRFTADYYIKNTRDLLNNVPLPASMGYGYTILNIGKIQNKGLEFVLEGDIINKKNLSWNVSANVSFNRNKVIKLYEGSDVPGTSMPNGTINDFVNMLSEGHPLGAFYGYRENGYDPNGKIQYVDSSGGNTINPTSRDKRFIGDPNPAFIYGFSSSIEYKGFKATIFIQGSQGNDIFNIDANTQNMDYGFGLNVTKDVYYNHWKNSNVPEKNASAKYPKISRATLANVSDRFVEDGSYMRLKNVELAYNLPLAKLGVKKLQPFQIYVSAQNLITFTGFSWFDPEVNYYGGANSIMQGINRNAYPSARSISFGIRLNF